MTELVYAAKTMLHAVLDDALGLLLILFAVALVRCAVAHFGKE